MEGVVEAEERSGDRRTMREKVTKEKSMWEKSAAGGLEDKNDWVAEFALIFAWEIAYGSHSWILDFL